MAEELLEILRQLNLQACKFSTEKRLLASVTKDDDIAVLEEDYHNHKKA